MSSPQVRRRQRSTRLTVAVALMVVAALAVAGTVLSGSWLLVTIAAVLSVVLGSCATRITHSELMVTRRDAGRDRAEQAQAYRDLTVSRTTEHAVYAANMQARLNHQEDALSALELALASAQKRSAAATLKFNAESRRGIVRVAELEQEIDVLRAELVVCGTEPVRRQA